MLVKVAFGMISGSTIEVTMDMLIAEGETLADKVSEFRREIISHDNMIINSVDPVTGVGYIVRCSQVESVFFIYV